MITFDCQVVCRNKILRLFWLGNSSFLFNIQNALWIHFSPQGRELTLRFQTLALTIHIKIFNLSVHSLKLSKPRTHKQITKSNNLQYLTFPLNMLTFLLKDQLFLHFHFLYPMTFHINCIIALQATQHSEVCLYALPVSLISDKSLIRILLQKFKFENTSQYFFSELNCSHH